MDIKDEKIQDNFNPLDEPVNEKSYSNPNVNTQGADFTKPIEEPTFTPPPFEKKNTTPDDKTPPKREPFNPDLKNSSKKDNSEASEYVANLIMNGYEQLHVVVNKSLQVSQKQLNKWQNAGEINLNAMIQYDYGKNMRAGEFFRHYNNQMENFLTVSPEFKEEVLPLLKDVLSERGIGMTKEQRLVSLVVIDALGKGMMFFQQKNILNGMVQSIKAATINQFAPPPPAADEFTAEQAQKEEKPNTQEPEEREQQSQQQNQQQDVVKRGAGRPRKVPRV